MGNCKKRSVVGVNSLVKTVDALPICEFHNKLRALANVVFLALDWLAERKVDAERARVFVAPDHAAPVSYDEATVAGFVYPQERFLAHPAQ